MESTLSQPVHMGVILRDTGGKTLADVENEIVNEKAWAAIVINSNATTMFQEALAGTGGLLDGEYAPKGAISLLSVGARWFQVVDE